MKMRLWPVLTASFVALAGCEQGNGTYDIVRAGNQTFVLNKKSGDAKLVVGTKLLPLGEGAQPDGIPAKQWPAIDIPQLGDLQLQARTKYRDGQMHYVMTAGPFEGRLEKEWSNAVNQSARPTLTVELSDADGFTTGEIKLVLRESTRVMGNDGKVNAVTWAGSADMSQETYRATTGHNVRWSGFSN